jgi:hypothetical protein
MSFSFFEREIQTPNRCNNNELQQKQQQKMKERTTTLHLYTNLQKIKLIAEEDCIKHTTRRFLAKTPSMQLTQMLHGNIFSIIVWDNLLRKNTSSSCALLHP